MRIGRDKVVVGSLAGGREFSAHTRIDDAIIEPIFTELPTK